MVVSGTCFCLGSEFHISRQAFCPEGCKVAIYTESFYYHLCTFFFFFPSLHLKHKVKIYFLEVQKKKKS